ncbi:disks large homolog 1-like [Brevipalpus obovatus]|uniref:disks large homolog 1-like n=1 Tax=Brevipalpus obovatus TaxID=246614 RepID=UPI003D9F5B9F
MIQTSPEMFSKEPRTVMLTKNGSALGFNIVGGEDTMGIFVSFLLPGGPADSSGQIHRGDQILSVNGVDLRNVTHEEAARILKNTGKSVTLVLQFQPDEYEHFETKISEIRENNMDTSGTLKTSQKKSLFIRALIEYDPTRDSGLPGKGLVFKFGDILHVINASDDEWWLAKRIFLNGKESELGLIPSKKRVEKRGRARQKNVKFGLGYSNSSDKKRKNFSFSRKFPFMKSRETLESDRIEEDERNSRLRPSSGNDHSSTKNRPEKMEKAESISFSNLEPLRVDSSRSINHSEMSISSTREDENSVKDDSILSYESVFKRKINYRRPVVILGPFRDQIVDDLITQYPERFQSCDFKKDGQNYIISSNREAIEKSSITKADSSDNHQEDKLVASIRRAIEKNRHCLLDLSPSEMKRLHAEDLIPISISIRAKSPASLMEMNKRMTATEAKNLYEEALQHEQEFTSFLTTIVSGDTPEEIYERVKTVIDQNDSDFIWAREKDQDI